MDVLTAKKTAFLQEEIIKNILSNHTAYLSKPSLKKLFIDWIQKFSDKIESLTLTEKIHNLGYDVKEYYLKKVQEVISSLNNEDKLPYLSLIHISLKQFVYALFTQNLRDRCYN